MKKKSLAIVLALITVFSIGTTALAADGDAATVPKGGTPGAGGFASTGSAEATGTGDIESIVGDDDNLAGTADTNGADISLWGRVASTSDGTIVYKLDINWGLLQFQFHPTGQVWDPATHSYKAGDGTAYWTCSSHTSQGYSTIGNHADNVITVTNHSNSWV